MAFTAVTYSGFSGFWNLTGDRANYSMSQSQSRAKASKKIAQWMAGRGVRDARAVFNALIGAASGGTASDTFAQIAPPVGPDGTVPGVSSLTGLGGARLINTITTINRATTAADVTELKKWVGNNSLLERGITYPTVAGNNLNSSTQVNGVVKF